MRLVQGERIGHRANREAGLETGQIGQFCDEGAIDDHQAPEAESSQHSLQRPARAPLLSHQADAASGLASRINRRRSVYFQASTRECGSPASTK